MTQQSEKQPPLVVEEEDTPLLCAGTRNIAESLSRETDAGKDLDFRKFSLGSATLGWCIFLMFSTMIISIWNPDNELVKNAFEAFKLIVMTVLGYIFGSKASK